MSQQSPSPQHSAVARVRETTVSRVSHSRRFRVEQLKALRSMLEENSDAFNKALYEDLGKHVTESMVTELSVVRTEIDHALLHLTDWMEPAVARVPVLLQPAQAKIRAVPLGMVLIIGAWNYPVQFTLGPLVAAIAAGNTAVIYPSAKAGHTAGLLAELVPRYLVEAAYEVVSGGDDVLDTLLEEKFDHIFFTGGTAMGRRVYRAAAETLTPVTLQLGGKSPCVVADGRHFATIARRIVFGKFLNAGQTSAAPDYVLVVGEENQRKLEDALAEAITEFYGEKPEESPEFARIISTGHTQRLLNLLSHALGESPAPRVVAGGEVSVGQKYVAPTVLSDVQPDSVLMREEIFGPVLPLIRVESFDEALAFIAARDEPMSAYLFTDKPKLARKFEDEVRAGALGFDVTGLHAALPTIPLGGIGASGFGQYRGKVGFDLFSQQRPSLVKTDQVDTLKMLYPPYNWMKRQAIKRIL